MINRKIFFVVLTLFVFLSLKALGENTFRSYMSFQNLQWEQLPMQWNEGAFLGNGRIGMVAYVDSVDNSLTLWLSRPDVTDHRLKPHSQTSMGTKNASVMTDFCRLDVGKMKLFPKGKILSGNFYLDIFHAELSGELNTSSGKLTFKAYTPYKLELNIVEVTSKCSYHWKFFPGNPQSPRIQIFPELRQTINYVNNPLPEYSESAYEGRCIQTLLAGGDYATYWKEIKAKSTCKSTLYIAIANKVPYAAQSLPIAEEEVNKAISLGNENIRKQTYRWWEAFHQKSFISIPDKKLENFYNIQMYKLATCSHPDGPVMDNLGAFYKTNQWPGIWWNLNVQLAYMSTYPTNRLEQGANYQKLLDNSFEDIMDSYKTSRMGDFAWALHNYYLYMRYAGCSWLEIKNKIKPKALKILNVYKTHLHENNGVIDLLQTESPEYEGFMLYDNSNYNLANLRWILKILIQMDDATHTQCSDYDYWKTLSTKLNTFQINENGFMIASEKPLNKSHRHYSHLLAGYPLRLLDTEKNEVKTLLEKSIDYWLKIDRGSALTGYSYTGAASLYAFVGNGEKAYEQLNHFINRSIGISLLLPNTLYVESGGKNPTIETPLSAATATAEMLLQTKGDTIKVFPAIPSNWSDCCFKNLRAEGGFVVSAQRLNGALSWITILSETGQPCYINLHSWKEVVNLSKTGTKIIKMKNGIYHLKLEAGEKITLSYSKKVKASLILDDASKYKNNANFYGVKKGKGFLKNMDWFAH